MSEQEPTRRFLWMRLSANEHAQVMFLLRALVVIITFVILAAVVMGVVVTVIY